ncbi:MAG: TauD/TfdA family dioxygenase, partial [Flavobacteriales bacterium]|nr:TauD/TfdA family dioxygenase [Flavobacteriales bacterium]
MIIKINRITSALGAEVSGIDLRQPLTDEVFDAIHMALLEYQVIFFREQR